MEIEYATTVRNTTVRVKMISQGTVFEGRVAGGISSDYPDKLFIKGYDTVISLDSGRQWGGPEIEIKDYRPVKAKVVVLSYE